MIDIRQIQDEIYDNKTAKGFSTTNVEKEFNLTYAELAEAYESYRKQDGGVAEELADVLIFVLSLGRMLDVDLEQALHDKLRKNRERTYTSAGDHHVQTVGSGQQDNTINDTSDNRGEV